MLPTCDDHGKVVKQTNAGLAVLCTQLLHLIVESSLNLKECFASH